MRELPHINSRQYKLELASNITWLHPERKNGPEIRPFIAPLCSSATITRTSCPPCAQTLRFSSYILVRLHRDRGGNRMKEKLRNNGGRNHRTIVHPSTSTKYPKDSWTSRTYVQSHLVNPPDSNTKIPTNWKLFTEESREVKKKTNTNNIKDGGMEWSSYIPHINASVWISQMSCGFRAVAITV